MNRLILFVLMLFPLVAHAFGDAEADASATANAGAIAGSYSSNKNLNLNANQNVNSVTSSNSLSNSNSASSYNRNYNQDYQGQSQGISIRNEAPDLSKMVPDSSAPALTTSNGTCMGSSSVGGSGIGFGASLGTTWTDKECNARYNAQLMYNMGYKTEALQILCSLDDVYSVMGEACYLRSAANEPHVELFPKAKTVDACAGSGILCDVN